MEKLTTCLLIFFFNSFVALLHAQDVNTLLEQLEFEKESVQKADLMFKLGVEYQKQNAYKKAIEYFTEAKRNQINNSGFENRCDQKILQSYWALKDYNNALKTADNLIQKSKQSNDEKQLIKNLNEGVELADFVKDYEKGNEYNLELAEIYKKNKDFTELGRVYNNLGVISRRSGNNQQSKNYFNEALQNNKNSLERKDNSLKNQVFTNINTGVTYLKLNQYSNADPYFNQALNIAQQSGDQKLLASAYNYLAMNDYLNDRNANAIGFANKARQIAELNDDSENKLNAYKVLALLYQSEEDYKESKIYNDKYTELLTKIEKQNQEEIQKKLQYEIDIEKKEAEFKNSLAEKQQQVAALKQSELEKEQQRLTLENQKKELAILRQEQALQLAKIREQQLEDQRTKNMLELTKQKAETDRQKAQTEQQKLLTQVQQREATLQAEKAKSQQKIAQEERKAKEASIEQGKLQADKLKQQFWINILALGIVALILAILFGVYRTLKQSKKLNNELADKNIIIEETNEELSTTLELVEKEKAKSDALLLNILPLETAQELKETGQSIPKHYDLVSVLFTDFKGFTQISENLEPQEVIEKLNKCFLALDEICEKNNLEKIKTIGDSYMCAGGIPIANTSNPVDCVKAGLEMQAWMEQWKAEKIAKGETPWELRLGIHSGPVVAGVIGKNKFAYDIWGDTVNSASRMESSGQVGKVNISGTTYQLVKDKFKCTYRGKMQIKNKGEVEMYFVDGLLPSLGS